MKIRTKLFHFNSNWPVEETSIVDCMIFCWSWDHQEITIFTTNCEQLDFGELISKIFVRKLQQLEEEGVPLLFKSEVFLDLSCTDPGGLQTITTVQLTDKKITQSNWQTLYSSVGYHQVSTGYDAL